MTDRGSNPPRAGSSTPTFTVVRAVVRTVPWRELAVGGVLATVVTWWSTASSSGTPEVAFDRVRLAAVLVAISMATAFDDRSRPHLDVTPVSVRRRRVVQLAAAVLVAAVGWAGTLLAASADPLWPTRGSGLPMMELTVVAIALVTTTLAVAAVVTRAGDLGGITPAVVTLFVVACAVAVPRLVTELGGPAFSLIPPMPEGGDLTAVRAEQAWVTAHRSVMVLALLATAVLLRCLAAPSDPRLVRRSVAGATSAPHASSTV